VSFFDHFDSGIDSGRWTTYDTGGGSVSASGGEVIITVNGTGAAGIKLNAPIDRTKDQTFIIPWKCVTGTGAEGWSIGVLTGQTHPVPDTLSNVLAAEVIRVHRNQTTFAISVTLADTSRQEWTGSAWGSPPQTALGSQFADDYHEVVLQLSFSNRFAAGGAFRIGIVHKASTSYSEQSGRRLVVLTDWVAWSDCTALNGDYWLHVGMPFTDFGSFSNVSHKVESVWHLDDGFQDFVFNGRAAGGAWSIQHGVGNRQFVLPGGRPEYVVQAGSGWENTQVTMASALALQEGSCAVFYSADGSGTGRQIGVATAPSPDGAWTKSSNNPIIANSGTTDEREFVQGPCVVEDVSADASERFKMLYTGVALTGGLQYRAFYAYAADVEGPWTLYDDGSGVSDSCVLDVGGSGAVDEIGCVVGGIRWDAALGQWEVWYGARDAAEQERVMRAYGPSLTSLTKDTTVYWTGKSGVSEATTGAMNDSAVATVSDTTGFEVDAMVAVALEDAGTNSDYYVNRIRRITANTSLEFYHKLGDAASGALITQFDNFNWVWPHSIEEVGSELWIYVTLYQPFLTADSFNAYLETSAILKADALTPPYSVTLDWRDTPFALQHEWDAEKSFENPGVFTAPIVRLQSYALTAEQGSFSLTGQDADLLANRLLTAAEGSYSLSGQDAGLLAGRLLTAAEGSYTLSGQAVSLLAGRLLTADQGSFTFAGQDASLLRGFLLSAEQGAFTLTGQDATLTYNQAGAYTLVAESGSFTLSGQDVSLLAHRLLTAEEGAYQITGQDADLLRGYLLAAQNGSYTISGQDVSLLAGRTLTAAQGSYTLTGQPVTFVYSGQGDPEATEIYVIPAEDRTYVIAAESRTYTIPSS
jgi:hypothetical protein